MVAFTSLAIALAAVGFTVAAPTVVEGPAVEARGLPNFILDDNHPLAIARRAANLTLLGRSNTNYKQDYTTGGSVQFNAGTNQFSLTYSVSQDFVVGVGWNPGSTTAITHSGSFSVNSGLGSLSVYGWTTNPLIEYYVMDCNHGITAGGTQKGSVSSDGSTYQIWQHQQTNQPSIQGTSTFQQFISINSACKTSGTISVENHFNAWKNLGMNMGQLNFQVIAVESWSGSGSATQSVTN